MATRDARVWNPIRMLRGKRVAGEAKEILPGIFDTSRHPVEAEGDQELFNRVKKWLHESQPPKLNQTKPNKYAQSQCSTLSVKFKDAPDDTPFNKTSTHSQEEPSDTTLYHPDFADWSSIEIVHRQAAKRQQTKSMDDGLWAAVKVFQF
jgi:hypothetical protein